MAKSKFKTVDEYIASQPEPAQALLHRLRATIRKALPGAEEVISYNIPAYNLLLSTTVLYFAGWKQHYSLYPAGARLVAEFQNELAPYEISKGTIRFPLAEPVPVKLITRIARFRAKEAGGRTNRRRNSINVRNATYHDGPLHAARLRFRLSNCNTLLSRDGNGADFYHGLLGR